jgi:hypothetical protein
MMRYAAIGILFLLSCSGNRTKQEDIPLMNKDTLVPPLTVSVDSSVKQKADTIVNSKIDTVYETYACYRNVIQPVSFKKSTPVYSTPDTLSEIIKNIKFDTPVKYNENAGWDWFEVQWDNKSGFVRSKDVASCSFNSFRNKNIRYFILPNFDREQNWEPGEVRIYKYNLAKKKFTDTFSIKDHGANYFRQLNPHGLKNVDLLLTLENTNGCCGCTLEKYYFIEANNKFEKIFTTSDFLDDGGEGYQNYSYVDFTPNSGEFVYNEYECTGVFNKKDEPVLDKNGNQKIKVIRDISKHYKWDGSKMVEIKK